MNKAGAAGAGFRVALPLEWGHNEESGPRIGAAPACFALLSKAGSMQVLRKAVSFRR
jgi:hypothetical protein